jgi:hypothetical protein
MVKGNRKMPVPNLKVGREMSLGLILPPVGPEGRKVGNMPTGEYLLCPTCHEITNAKGNGDDLTEITCQNCCNRIKARSVGDIIHPVLGDKPKRLYVELDFFHR